MIDKSSFQPAGFIPEIGKQSAPRRIGKAKRRALFLFSLVALLPESTVLICEPLSDDPPGIELEKVIATRGDLPRGRFVRWITGKGDPHLFRRPYGIAWHGDDLLVTDPGKSQVLRIPQGRGKLRASAEGLFRSPIGVVSCGRQIAVTDSRLGGVALLDPDLELERWLQRGLKRPTGLACDGHSLFVAETGRHRVLLLSLDEKHVPAKEGPIFSATGKSNALSLGKRGAANGEFNFPTTVTIASGHLWVGDTLNFRLQRFDLPSGRFLGSFGKVGDSPGEMPRLKGVAADGAGNLWVSDAYLDEIALFSPAGSFLGTLGHPGALRGEFSFPAGIAAHNDGRMAIVDSLNRRVQVFRLERSKRGTGS